jgi:zinc protease
MREASGAGEHSANDLVRLLSGKNVSLGFLTDAYTRSVSGYSSVKDLKTFFELLYLTWTQPRFDEHAVRAYFDRLNTALAQYKEDPDGYFNDELTKALYARNPYFMPLEAEDLERASLQDAREVTLAGLNPADWTFVFTGNIDASFDDYLATYLASIPAAARRVNTYAEVGVTRPQPEKRVVEKGQENRSTVYSGYFARAPFAWKDALAAAILSEYLDIYFNNLMREQLGGVYAIDISARLSPLPPPGELALEAYFYCDPSRADELLAAIQDGLEKAARGDISPALFAEAAEAQIKEWEENMQDNAYLASRYANYAVIFGLPLSRVHERDKALRTITPADVQAVAQRLHKAGAFVFVMNPQAAAH